MQPKGGRGVADETLYFGNRVPFLTHIGVHPGKMSPDRVSAKLDFSASLANSGGYMHGGSLMSALDFAMSAVARSSEPNELHTSTIEMKTSFIRPAVSDVDIEARCIHRGRSIAFCEATARDGKGDLIASASGVFKLSRKAQQGHAG
jgi:uncharacterized protein (TIGR00369 family)